MPRYYTYFSHSLTPLSLLSLTQFSHSLPPSPPPSIPLLLPSPLLLIFSPSPLLSPLNSSPFSLSLLVKFEIRKCRNHPAKLEDSMKFGILVHF